MKIEHEPCLVSRRAPALWVLVQLSPRESTATG